MRTFNPELRAQRRHLPPGVVLSAPRPPAPRALRRNRPAARPRRIERSIRRNLRWQPPTRTHPARRPSHRSVVADRVPCKPSTRPTGRASRALESPSTRARYRGRPAPSRDPRRPLCPSAAALSTPPRSPPPQEARRWGRPGHGRRPPRRASRWLCGQARRSHRLLSQCPEPRAGPTPRPRSRPRAGIGTLRRRPSPSTRSGRRGGPAIGSTLTTLGRMHSSWSCVSARARAAPHYRSPWTGGCRSPPAPWRVDVSM
mmetsp:Transcript_99671/g.319849  ORF Transcript_99671/g.319849 Transcript_99671/m.319849 type:complete len:257 (-) Transcript_99671:77-847(-)